MKKLLSLALTLAMLASTVICTATETTEITDTTTLPVTSYIDNWDFEQTSTPTNAFQALPELVTTEDGVTAAKFDAYANKKNTGFISLSWADTTGDYIAFDLRIKADKQTTKTMHLLDANQMTYKGTSLNVVGFDKITLTANKWNEITLVMDISNKSIEYNDNGTVKNVSNIKPVVLVVNGNKNTPSDTTKTITITNRRNFIEPYKNNDVLTQDGIIYMDYYRTYTTTAEAVTELLTDRETYLVSKYIDNWNFSDGSQPTNSWQKLPVFSDGIAEFNTYTSTAHPCFDGTDLRDYAGDTETNKFLVLEFAIKGVKEKMTSPLRMLNKQVEFQGTELKATGFGKITLDVGAWHKVVYVLNLKDATLANDSLSGIQPYLMYIDGDKYKPSEDKTLTFPKDTNRTWLERKTGNTESADVADIVYMDCYKTYIADAAEVEADATYLKTTTKYTPVGDPIVNRDFDYKGDMGSAFGMQPVLTQLDDKGVAEFNSDNSAYIKDNETKYNNIGFNEAIKFEDMTEDYVVLETSFKYGDTDASDILMFGGMLRIVKQGTDTRLRVYGNSGLFDTDIDRNVWYDVALVVDRSTFLTDGVLKAVKLTVGESEFNLLPKSITWAKEKIGNAERMYLESKAAGTKLWLDYYKAYQVKKDAFAFGGTSKYTMNELVYDYEFDLKGGTGFGNGDREAVTLDDGTKAVKLTGYTGPNGGTNAGFGIYSGDGKGTTVVETKIMIPENDGAKSYCLANIIELKTQTAQEETEEDTLGVSLYEGGGKIADGLKFGEWHTFEVVVDNDNKRYLTLTIDGTKYDIANGFRATANDEGSTRYYVEGKEDAKLTETKSHVMYIDYMKSYKINDYLSAPKYTADGVETLAIETGKTLNVSIDVNTEIKDVTEAVNVALYSGNKLVTVIKGTYDKDAKKVTANIDVPSGIENAKVKVLGWNGVTTLKPIMPADTFPKN